MTCTCENVRFGDYTAQVLVEAPKHLKSVGCYELRGSVGIDLCILPEVQYLWRKEIITTGSCCGHGIIDGTICVAPEHQVKMLDLGYSIFQGRSHIFTSFTCKK